MTSPSPEGRALAARVEAIIRQHLRVDFVDCKVSGIDTAAAAVVDALGSHVKFSLAVKALEDAAEVLGLSERPAFPDPQYHEEVKALGRRIGFGALMHTAEAGWREVLKERGDPTGSEHTAGPCRSTVDDCLKTVRNALAILRSATQAEGGGG
jgi:hypothetical protein